ncbi:MULTISPECIES: GNAT family N-acetyltransferase [unclassified Microbacterium]|uniref:GNAT family N-acetyltransferase n=1 Tax=unclassified Microbacterium TaxID=2609290 RepID=UPI00300FA653
MTTLAPLTAADHDDWLTLWTGYLDFYEATIAPDVTAHTFERLVAGIDMHATIARDDDGTAVGLVHWLAHPATWTRGPYCYLEDLFVVPSARGAGTGRALIGHVATWARENGCAKVYWLTQSGNTAARVLYDRVARDTGFVQYAIP